MLETNKLPSVIIKEKGMEVVSDAGAIEKIVDEVIAANPKAIEDFKKGKTNVVGWLMGQVMKASQGKANPGQATKMISEKLSKCRLIHLLSLRLLSLSKHRKDRKYNFYVKYRFFKKRNIFSLRYCKACPRLFFVYCKRSPSYGSISGRRTGSSWLGRRFCFYNVQEYSEPRNYWKF